MDALRPSRLRRPALLAALLGAMSGAAEAGSGFQDFALLEFVPAGPTPGTPPEILRGLLALPPDWRPGDGAAIVLLGAPPQATDTGAIAAGLLAEGAAVLELRLPAAGRDAAALLPELFGALRALRQQAGSGLVVAIGTGTGGDAALLAADPALATWHLGPDGPRFTAHAQLGAVPRFAAGLAPESREGWPGRAPPLCATLAAVTAAPHGSAAIAQDCRAALLAPR